MTRIQVFCSLVFAIVCFAITDSFAQAKISVGPQIGLNMATVSASPMPSGVSISRHTFFVLGGFAEFKLAGGLSLQPELWYMMKGGEGTEGDVITTFKISYVEIPLLAKYVMQGEAFKPYVLGGLFLSFKSSAEITEKSTTTNIDAQVSSTDFGLMIGGGGEVQIAPKTALMFSLRYAFGLSGIQNGKLFGESTVKTDGIMLVAGAKVEL